MTTATEWRSEITADDPVGWLVWSDWLDDHGDERADWIRRFVADGRRPVDSGEYGVYWHYSPDGGVGGLGWPSDCDYFGGRSPYPDAAIDAAHGKYETAYDALIALAEACIEAEKQEKPKPDVGPRRVLGAVVSQAPH